MASTTLEKYLEWTHNESVAFVFHVSHEICGTIHNNLWESTRISTKILQTTTFKSRASSEYGIGDKVDQLDLCHPFQSFIHRQYLGGRMEILPFYPSLGARASRPSWSIVHFCKHWWWSTQALSCKMALRRDPYSLDLSQELCTWQFLLNWGHLVFLLLYLELCILEFRNLDGKLHASWPSYHFDSV